MRLLLALCAVALAEVRDTRQQVLLDHDGGVDDYLALLLYLTEAQRFKTLGIVVTPADSYGAPALNITRKMLQLLGAELPLALSTAVGAHPFPDYFREDSYKINLLPLLNDLEGQDNSCLSHQTAQELMVELLEAAPSPVHFLVLGPLSNVAAVLQQRPELATRIAEVVWMGGALKAPGNILEKYYSMEVQDGTAEWNVFWDPAAAHFVFHNTSIPLTLVPLDTTNLAPISSSLLTRLARLRRYPLADLAGQIYSLVGWREYFYWDVLTTAFFVKPELFSTATRRVAVVAAGRSAGRTVDLTEEESCSSLPCAGREVTVVDGVKELQVMEDYFLKQLEHLPPECARMEPTE